MIAAFDKTKKKSSNQWLFSTNSKNYIGVDIQ